MNSKEISAVIDHHEFDRLIDSEGFVLLKNYCERNILDQLKAVCQVRSTIIRDALENKTIGIGSANGYDEVVQRSEGRWDLPISPLEFGVDEKAFPWWPLVARLLGDDAEHAFSGVVSSEPGSPAQDWHIDSPHASAEHLPAHILNVFVALEDVTMAMGPTEFAVGSTDIPITSATQRLSLIIYCTKVTARPLKYCIHRKIDLSVIVHRLGPVAV